MDPESTGLNPAWRNSLAYTVISTIWKDGADSTQIGVARQRFIQDMKTLEGIAPDSGAYSNEVRNLIGHCFFRFVHTLSLRLLDMNLTGRNPFLALITINSSPSSRNTIRIPFSSFTKASDQTSGMQALSARPDNIALYPLVLNIRYANWNLLPIHLRNWLLAEHDVQCEYCITLFYKCKSSIST